MRPLPARRRSAADVRRWQAAEARAALSSRVSLGPARLYCRSVPFVRWMVRSPRGVRGSMRRDAAAGGARGEEARRRSDARQPAPSSLWNSFLLQKNARHRKRSSHTSDEQPAATTAAAGPALECSRCASGEPASGTLADQEDTELRMRFKLVNERNVCMQENCMQRELAERLNNSTHWRAGFQLRASGG